MSILSLITTLLFFISKNSFSVELNSEDLRWNLPADAWPYIKGYTAKGHYLRIASKTRKIEDKDLVNGIKLFVNPNLKGEHYLLTYSNVQDSEGKIICNGQLPFEEVQSHKELLVCDSFCSQVRPSGSPCKKSEPLKVILFDSYLKSGLYGDCEVQPEGFIKLYLDRNGSDNDNIGETIPYKSQNTDFSTNYYLKTEDKNLLKGHVSINIKEKKYYLDTSFCQKNSICTFIDIDKSEYEKEMEKLAIIKEKKNFGPLNLFIKELKPCVVNKDKKCIKKFFPKPVTEMEAEIDGVYLYEEVDIDDELISELLACLDYESLLPHMLAMRGIKKACLMKLPDIGGENLLMVDYPEAVRYREDFPILLKKK